MIKIRLSRKGVIKNPFYKIVAIDNNQKRDGKVVEVLGFWQPKKDLKQVKNDRINYWLSQGAQITKSVKELFNKK